MDEYKLLKNDDSSIIQPESVEEQECFISFNETTIGWNSALSNNGLSTSDDDEITLEHVSFTVKRDQVVAIVGHVGSGKVRV